MIIKIGTVFNRQIVHGGRDVGQKRFRRISKHFSNVFYACNCVLQLSHIITALGSTAGHMKV